MGTDREGFEPSIPLRAYRFSRPAVSTAHPPVLLGVFLIVRTGWDSNPRNGCPLTRFPSVRLKPLGHPSRHNKVIAALPSLKPEFAAVHLAEVSARQCVEETDCTGRLIWLQSLTSESL